MPLSPTHPLVSVGHGRVSPAAAAAAAGAKPHRQRVAARCTSTRHFHRSASPTARPCSPALPRAVAAEAAAVARERGQRLKNSREWGPIPSENTNGESDSVRVQNVMVYFATRAGGGGGGFYNCLHWSRDIKTSSPYRLTYCRILLLDSCLVVDDAV